MKRSFIKLLTDRLAGTWSFMRLLRLALAILIMVESFFSASLLSASLGAVLLLQAITNRGCCSGSACDIDHVLKK